MDSKYFSDYARAFRKSIDILKAFGLCRLPVDIFKIIDRFPRLKLETYTNLAAKNNCELSEIISMFESDLGVCVYDEVFGNAIIYYNDTLNNYGLIRFTVTHEFGHYVLGHFDYIDEKIIKIHGGNDNLYKIFEREANCFARNLLCPSALVELFGIADSHHIASIFKISNKAAKVRLDMHKKYDRTYLNEHILNDFNKKFSYYIEKYQKKKPDTYISNLERAVWYARLDAEFARAEDEYLGLVRSR